MEERVELGDLAKDPISGFEGVVVAHSVWAHNVDSMGLRARELKEGKTVDEQWFDANDLVLIEKGVAKVTPADDSVYEFGDKVADVLSKYEGTVMGYTKWISGCIRIGVQAAELNEGKPVDEQWFSMSQLQLLIANPAYNKAAPKTGGPMKAPTTFRNPC